MSIGTFDFRHPDAPRRVEVATLRPAAPDGEEWLAAILPVARSLGASRGSLTPSALRLRASTLGLNPPHPNHWGALLWSRLKAEGWTPQDRRVLSTTPTRNAVKEQVWVPPETAS